MIVTGYVGQHIVPLIHSMPQLDSIYVFCGKKSRFEQWAKQWSKVKGVFTESDFICQSISMAICQYNQDSIPMSFVSTSNATNINLNELDHTFMYTQILKEILLEINFDTPKSVRDLAIYCHEMKMNNAEITKFRK